MRAALVKHMRQRPVTKRYIYIICFNNWILQEHICSNPTCTFHFYILLLLINVLKHQKTSIQVQDLKRGENKCPTIHTLFSWVVVFQPCPGDSLDQTTLRNQRASETCRRLRENRVIDPDLYNQTGSRYSDIGKLKAKS